MAPATPSTDLHGDDGIEILGRPVGIGRRLHARIGLLRRRVAAHLAAGLEQRLDQRRQDVRRRPLRRPAAFRSPRTRRCAASWR